MGASLGRRIGRRSSQFRDGPRHISCLWPASSCFSTDGTQILARVYGDPTSVNGLQVGAETALAATLSRMAETPGLLAKLFYVQLSDAERLDPPLSPTHPYYDAAQKPNMQWSRNARLFPCEEDRGGYLPVEAVVKVLFEDVGFRGWVSMEVFSRTMLDPDPATPRAHAERGIRSWKTLLHRLEHR